MSNEPSPPIAALSGWEATAPIDDTALRQFLVAQSAFQRISGEALHAEIMERDEYIAVDTGRPATMLNFAIIRQPLCGPALESAMNALTGFYAGDGKRGFVALYSPLPTADLSAWGWNLAGHPPLQLRSPFTPPHETGPVRIEPVETTEQQELFERIIIDGFEFEEMRDSEPGSLLGDSLFADGRFKGFLGFVDEQPVSAAGSILEAGIVNVVMVATIPAGRRRGAGLAVTQAASRLDLGLPTVLFSSDEGRRVYERLGFVPILRGAFWYRMR